MAKPSKRLSVIAVLLVISIGTGALIFGGLNNINNNFINILTVFVGLIMIYGGVMLLSYILDG